MSSREFSDSLKAVAVGRHLVDNVPVGELGVQPSMIHVWVKQILEQAEKVLCCMLEEVETQGVGQHRVED